VNDRWISREAVLSERLWRHGLARPLTQPAAYVLLFRSLQPVSPFSYSRPGDPPRLAHRTAFDDSKLTNRMRAQRAMVKGRFLGGTIGYVLTEDLPTYAAAFRRPLHALSQIQQTVLEAMEHSAPMTPRQMKEETGLLNKHIMPALHRLQQAFLVYEDQVNSDWERAWYLFGAEWPEVLIEDEPWEPSAAQVLLRFLRALVFATFEQIRDWSGFASRSVSALMEHMEKRGDVLRLAVEGLGEGWIRVQDRDLEARKAGRSVFMLHKSDFLVRSHASQLKQRFGGEVLQYLLIDGAFQGAVLGHWRIGPHDVEDVIVELPHAESTSRREEIVKAVAWAYHPPHSRILRYNGRPLSRARSATSQRCT